MSSVCVHGFSLTPRSHGGHCVWSGFGSYLSDIEVRRFWESIMGCKQIYPFFSLLGDIIFIIPVSKPIGSFLWREIVALPFSSVSSIHILEKIVLNRSWPVSLFNGCAEIREIHGETFPNGGGSVCWTSHTESSGIDLGPSPAPPLLFSRFQGSYLNSLNVSFLIYETGRTCKVFIKVVRVKEYARRYKG